MNDTEEYVKNSQAEAEKPLDLKPPPRTTATSRKPSATRLTSPAPILEDSEGTEETQGLQEKPAVSPQNLEGTENVPEQITRASDVDDELSEEKGEMSAQEGTTGATTVTRFSALLVALIAFWSLDI
ncbi:unnamed protein product, partial [Mesorhabditis spiculigera]